jgi:NADH-quinone oxidoreductase subunit L
MGNTVAEALIHLVDASSLSQSLWLIIALPLLGAALNGLLGPTLGRANVNFLACAAVGTSFLLSVLCFLVLNDRNQVYAVAGAATDPAVMALGHDYGTWFASGSFSVHFGLLVDHLSGTLLLVITGVGFLIHVYSTAYMEHDEGYWRYFAYLNLFVAMMLTLVMADSMVLTFVGWEGVGMCSYLLIGFWYTDEQKAFAGRKAFITNRVGDFGFVIGMMLLTLLVTAYSYDSRSTQNFEGNPLQKVAWNRSVDPSARESSADSAPGPLNYQNLAKFASTLAAGTATGVQLSSTIPQGPLQGFTYGAVITVAMLLFLLGAAGKSAQIPLYVWLPDAMAGPTPVSALIHAATMVTAGVYLFCRISFLLVLSPTAMAAVALIGACTALFAAVIAFAQDDIKKVLAYSTVSQLGFMFMAAGLGVFWGAVLHLVTHAFFKACLFLGAGSVMHGNGDETDIKKLGGLRHEMRLTWVTFATATVAITGVVPLSGFFSKDAILDSIHETTLANYPTLPHLIWGMGLLAAACTAFYMTRLYVLTFEGPRAKNAKVAHAHESPRAMTWPLVVLAGLSIAALVHGLPAQFVGLTGGDHTLMENYLRPVFQVTEEVDRHVKSFSEEPSTLTTVLSGYALAWVLAALGTAAAAFAYLKFFPSRAGKPVPAPLAAVRSLVQHKFYIDELYELFIIKPLNGLAQALYTVVDSFFIDTVAVRGTAWVTRQTGNALRLFQTGNAQTYAAVMALALCGGFAYALLQVFK